MKTFIDITICLAWYIWTIYTDKREYRAALLETCEGMDK